MGRSVLIGLDGATFTVLNPLFESGEMPFLREFMANGAYADLASTIHPLTPQAWTSMITGRNPGSHGIFDFIHCRQTREGIFFTLNMSYDLRCPTLWSIVSRMGMRVAVLNFPVSYPAEPVNGICVPAFMNWRHLRKAVYPSAFYDTMRMIPGFDSKFLSMDTNQEFQSIQYLPDEQYESWITHHIQREECWFNLIDKILTEDPPDLTACIFDGVDKLQHLCWRFLDPAFRPSRPTPWEAHILELCLTYFRKLDDIIRRIVVAAGSEARIFVASDHGFGPTEVVYFANAWLAQNGYLHWKDKAADEVVAETTKIGGERIKFQVEEIDWSRTSAFALNPSSNGIYIRQIAGNGPLTTPRPDYFEFRDRLVQELSALTDPFTGEQFFKGVLTREHAYPGDAAARAPDITLLPRDNGFISVVDSDEVFRLRPEVWGTHYPQGVFAAGGPNVSPLGRMPGLQIVDVASILLRSLGVQSEVEMEGRCPEGLFEGDWLPQGHPDEAAVVVERELQSPDVEIQEEVLNRLRAVGYLAQ